MASAATLLAAFFILALLCQRVSAHNNAASATGDATTSDSTTTGTADSGSNDGATAITGITVSATDATVSTGPTELSLAVAVSASTTGKPETTKPAPTNSTHKPDPCDIEEYNDCHNCTSDKKCVWCEASKKCISGGFYGPRSPNLVSCSDWRWHECKVNLQVIRWVIVGVLAALVLVTIVLIFCCCCGRRGQSTSEVDRIELEQSESLLGAPSSSRTPQTDAWREKMRQKYGIGNNSDS